VCKSAGQDLALSRKYATETIAGCYPLYSNQVRSCPEVATLGKSKQFHGCQLFGYFMKNTLDKLTSPKDKKKRKT
jgi:hypothetical protein